MPEPTKPDDQQLTPPGTAPGKQPGTGDPPAPDLSTAGADTGAGATKKKGEKPEGVTPEVEAYLNAELAKARRSSSEEGKRKAREELEEEQAAATATTEEKLNKANADLLTAKAEKAAAETQLRKLLMAIKVGLPNPDVNWKRLIDTDDDEALEADAVSLKESFGAPKAPQTPPITPGGRGGGRTTQEGTRSETETEEQTKVVEQAKHPMYVNL